MKDTVIRKPPKRNMKTKSAVRPLKEPSSSMRQYRYLSSRQERACTASASHKHARTHTHAQGQTACTPSHSSVLSKLTRIQENHVEQEIESNWTKEKEVCY